MPIKAYKQRLVNPDIYNKEILMTKADLKKEKAYYETFLYGTPEEKVAALDWLQSCGHGMRSAGYRACSSTEVHASESVRQSSLPKPTT